VNRSNGFPTDGAIAQSPAAISTSPIVDWLPGKTAGQPPVERTIGLGVALRVALAIALGSRSGGGGAGSNPAGGTKCAGQRGWATLRAIAPMADLDNGHREAVLKVAHDVAFNVISNKAFVALFEQFSNRNAPPPRGRCAGCSGMSISACHA
jgi:hypothetical protein